MKIGIMGGTFDPIHNGHMIGAETARESMKLDEVWFLPANVPPHKDKVLGATPQQRLEMVKLAIAGHPDFRAEDLEIRKGGISYTMETAQILLKQYPRNTFYWIIGADMIQFLPQWHEINQLVQLISFIGLSRPGYSSDLHTLAGPVKDKITMVPMPQMDISASGIRERCRLHKSLRYLISEQVRHYIEEHHLYES
ncbi:MAG TPA: nicotinate-nucleotide adenylyltransferase [Bacilli bacterium]